MTVRDSVTATAAVLRDRPGLFVLGTAVSAVQMAVVAGSRLVQAAAGRAVSGPRLATQPFDPTLVAYLGPVLAAVVLLFTMPLLVAVYVPARRPPTGLGGTLRTGIGAVRRRYRPLLAATLRAEAVAVAAAVVVALGWYVVATVGRTLLYAAADPAPPYPIEPLLLLLGAFLVGLAVARVTVGFADLAALSADVAPADAWRVSIGFAGRRPRLVAGYAVLVAAVSAFALVPASATGGPAGLAVGVVLGGVSLTVAAVLHVAVFDRHGRAGEPGVPTRLGRWSVGSWTRVAVAGLVLLAGVAGAAGIRIDETAVHDPGFEDPAPDASPNAVYATARQNTLGSNHRLVLRSYDRSEADGRPDLVWEIGYDYRDRQASLRFYGPPDADADDGGGGWGYYDSGVLGVAVGGQAEQERRGAWTPIPAPGWAFAVDRPSGRSYGSKLPTAGANWTVVAENESTLVLLLDSPEAIRAAFEPDLSDGMGGNMTEDSFLMVWIDRDRVVVDRAVWHVHSRDTGDNFGYEVRTSGVGSYDVVRPAAMPPRKPLEWLWDAVYY